MNGIADAGLLFGTGIIGGIVGAVAGGAGLFTFPALLYVGLNPVVASASNFVALIPTGIAAVLAARHQLSGTRGRICRLMPTIIVGSMLGAVLLISIPVPTFTKVFPALLLLATVLFAFAPMLTGNLAAGPGRRSGVVRQHGLLFLAGVYCGLFGAGAGIIIMAALSLTAWRTVQQLNAVKNISISIASLSCIWIFIAGDSVHWKETLTVMSGAIVGGYIGGTASEHINEKWIRRIVIATGLLLSAYYGIRALLLP